MKPSGKALTKKNTASLLNKTEGLQFEMRSNLQASFK